MDKKIQVVLFDEEELSKTLIESYLQEVTFPHDVLRFNSFDGALIPQTDEKKLIVVNINNFNSSTLSEIAKFSQNTNNLFLIISYDKSADLQVKALRTGAKDFLSKPLIQADFIEAVTKIYKSEIMADSTKLNSKIYTVSSIEDGVGKTFFVFNMAKELCDLTGEKVLIIDFNDDLNDIASSLNVTVNFNTPYFINKTTEENADEMFKKIVTYNKTNVFIMGNGMFRNEEVKIDVKKLPAFLDIVKKHFKYIVIDTDNAREDINKEIAPKTDLNYVVITPSLTVAEKAKFHMEFNLQGKPCRVILNKYNSKKEEALLPKIEQNLGRQIFLKIPKNIMATSSAINKGASIKEVSPTLDISKAYMQLAKYMQTKDK